MITQYAQDVYETLIGEMEDGFCIPGVENLFIEGSECEIAYDEMLEAYGRLRERLGVLDEDADVETIIGSFLKIQRLVALNMFEYGKRIG